MESLAVLYRMYRNIVDSEGSDWTPSVRDKLKSWLRDDLLPEIHKLGKSPTFREHARWALDRLLDGSASKERALISEVDERLVKSAKLLDRFYSVPNFEERIADRFEVEVPLEQMVTLGAGSPPKTAVQKIEKHCRARESRRLIRQIASRFWADLASERDYFEPVVGWPTTDSRRTFPAAFTVSFTPAAHAGGDYISRCVILRVESLLRDFEQAIPILKSAYPELCPSRKPPTKKWKKFEDAFVLTINRAKHLRHVLLENEDQPLRDACILLTQVGAALSPEFDLRWLGSIQRHDAFGVGYRLRESKEIFERIARALLALRGLEQPTSGMSEVDEAISRGGLVILLDECEVYWQRKRLHVKWSRFRKQWQLLLLLAEKARNAMSVAINDPKLYQEVRGDTAFPMLCLRLKSHLPANLRKLIRPGELPKTYKLFLEGGRITVI